MGDYIERETMRVLTEGLPEMPERLERGQTIPLARWHGERFGAVLFVRRWKNDQIDTDTAISQRLPDGTWEEPYAYSGGPWFHEPLAPLPRGTAAGAIAWSGLHGNDEALVSIGKATDQVAGVQVSQCGRSWVVPVESPSGAVLVGVEGDEAPTWVAIDQKGSHIGEGGSLPSATSFDTEWGAFEERLIELGPEEVGRGEPELE